jgi:hypothetical protein
VETNEGGGNYHLSLDVKKKGRNSTYMRDTGICLKKAFSCSVCFLLCMGKTGD